MCGMAAVNVILESTPKHRSALQSLRKQTHYEPLSFVLMPDLPCGQQRITRTLCALEQAAVL